MITLDSLNISTTIVDMPIQGVVIYYTDKNITIIDLTKLIKNTRLFEELHNLKLEYIDKINAEYISCSFGDYIPDRTKFADYIKILAIDSVLLEEIEKLPFKKPVVSTKITRRTIRKKRPL